MVEKSTEMTREKLEYLFKRRHDRPGDVFMELLKQDRPVACASVYHAMGAKEARLINEKRSEAGLSSEYNAVYLGGYAVSGMLWGLPDNGFHDLGMMTMIGKYVVLQAHPMPVIMDAETGFGNSITCTRTVQEYHNIGVAVAHIEDQVFEDPNDGDATRSCGNQGGKTTISITAMEKKIRSWLEASDIIGTSMRLIARTDTLTAVNGGIKEVIERGKRYMSVEVNGLRPIAFWVDALIKPEDIEELKTEMRRFDPNIVLCLNNSPNKDWPDYYRKHHGCEPPTYAELYDNGNGFRIIHHTIMDMRAHMEASWKHLENQAENGNKALYELQDRQRGLPYGNAHIMTDTHLYQEYQRYIGGESAEERFKRSKGFGGGELV